MRITISGPPGSGKTTACKSLSEALGYKSVVFGSLFRQKAADMNVSVAELGRLAELDPSIDREIDSEILKIAEGNEDIILESRLPHTSRRRKESMLSGYSYVPAPK